MKQIHIIMPMGGEGSRFKNVGILEPKPLIIANKKFFFKRAIESICKYDFKLTCIVREEHIINYNIDKVIKDIYSDANILSVEKTTRGAVETCMLAKDYITDDEIVIVLDCDLEFFSPLYLMYLYTIRELNINNIDGLIPSFNSTLPKYSYAKIDELYNITEVAEKNPISNNALIGAYCFANGKDFKYYANKLIKQNDLTNNKEFYTSLLYNMMIKDGKNIKLCKVEKYNSFGTPEELKEYEDRCNIN